MLEPRQMNEDGLDVREANQHRLRPIARSVDRKLLAPAMIARIETQFHLPQERTEAKSDVYYRSTETPNGLGT
jgi:hypothetical protein